jgi:hypothetical protein
MFALFSLTGFLVVVACWLSTGRCLIGGMAELGDYLARAQEQGARLDCQVSDIQSRLARRIQVVEELIEGRLTFSEAVEEFLQLEVEASVPPRHRSEEAAAGMLMDYIEAALEDDPQAANALGVFRAEFRSRYGKVQ